MSRLFKMPRVIAEYTIGTAIVMMQMGVIQPLEERRQRKRRLLRN